MPRTSFEAFLADWRRARLGTISGGLTETLLRSRAAELDELALRHGYAEQLATAARPHDGVGGLVEALYDLERESKVHRIRFGS